MKFRLRPHHRKRSSHQPDGPLRSRLLRFARKRNQQRKLAVTNRYEVGMVISEILTGLLFISGSILMFYPQMKNTPTVLYLVGSIMMLLRSGLRGSYWFHFKSHKQANPAEADSDTDWTR